MAHREPKPLPIAVRVFPVLDGGKERAHSRKRGRRPEAILVIDTESSTDPTQKFIFGSSRLIVGGRCLEEVLFYADDLQDTDCLTLELYVANHPADTAREGAKQIRLMPRREFVEYLYRLAYKARVWIVGFNLPFDLSRLAISYSPARGLFGKRSVVTVSTLL
jgi:hypothetical protein